MNVAVSLKHWDTDALQNKFENFKQKPRGIEVFFYVEKDKAATQL